MKESQSDGNEACMAKMKMKAEKHRESKADSVIISIPEEIVSTKTHEVLNAYEQCKMECKKKRDNIETQEYVEQLRSELAVAEEALAAVPVDPVTISILATEEAREAPSSAN
ncbi:unnamed protein product [Angiostrongylus costaricensis]|uniref:Tubulin-specific chaperone A n=1 Tax=Angiostrongylus costaricensis TaxID=334426 RepID=A0A158PGR1_ANGCS|nr:unnamed protein product [Angiostrongylus costaricensis]